MKTNIPFNPFDIDLFRGIAVMLDAERCPDFIQKG